MIDNNWIQHMLDEIHFIEATVNNLEFVKIAQEGQKDDGWVHYSTNVIRDLKDRAALLNNRIRYYQER
jgi:hypothetical protein